MQMGYLGVKAVVDHLQGKKLEKVVDTGVTLVTRENMEEARIKELIYPPLEKYLK